MSSSERPSRIVRGGAGWEPLRMAALVAAGGRPNGARSSDRDRHADTEARIAAAFRDGVAEGRYQADAEAQVREQALGQSAGQRWEELLGHLAGGIAEIETAMADRLLDLSAVLAARIACREIALSKERIEPVLAEALALLTGAARELEVAAHPADCEAIETWLRPRCGETSLAVRPDPSLTPGGCLLRANDAVFDATVQTRIIRTLAAVGIDGDQAGPIAAAAAAPLAAEPGPEEPA